MISCLSPSMTDQAVFPMLSTGKKILINELREGAYQTMDDLGGVPKWFTEMVLDELSAKLAERGWHAFICNMIDEIQDFN